jgi:Holliday junction resolvase
LGGLGIDDNTIKKWEMDLSSHQALIDRVVGLRDQVYAHTDSNAKDLDKVDITFEDVKKLIEFAEEIIQEIHSAILGVEARLFPPVFEAETFDIIKILAEQERREFE